MQLQELPSPLIRTTPGTTTPGGLMTPGGGLKMPGIKMATTNPLKRLNGKRKNGMHLLRQVSMFSLLNPVFSQQPVLLCQLSTEKMQ